MLDNIDLPYGKTISCECGKTHRIKPEKVFYGKNILENLEGVLENFSGVKNITVIMDNRTSVISGEKVCDIAGRKFTVNRIILEDNKKAGTPVCDDITFEKIKAAIQDIDLVVPVGSGVISDLGKWVADYYKIPCITIATAASMNGYASTNIAPTLNGIKSVVWAICPEYIFADSDVIKNAPYELTASGLGDILAKSVSSTDWFMNHLIWDDYYCQRSVDLIKDVEPLYFNNSAALKNGDENAQEALFHALLLTGVAMTMVETSFPASGAEHMISHTLDMMSMLDGVEHDLHGRQVGIGTVLTSEVYRKVLSVESPDFVEPITGIDTSLWGNIADLVNEEYQGKITRLNEAREFILKGNNWDMLREKLSPMVRHPKDVKACLENANAATRAGHIKIDKQRLITAFKHSHEIRSRFTVIDLANLFGILPSAIDEIFVFANQRFFLTDILPIYFQTRIFPEVLAGQEFFLS